MKVAIIGLGTAGFAAILAIKKLDKSAEITVIDKKKFNLQHSCGLPYVLEGKIKIEDLEHNIGAESMNVNVLSECEATKINCEENNIEYKDKDGNTNGLSYDKLFLGLGSSPFIPPIGGLKENPNVFSVQTTDDMRKIEGKAESGKKAVIIGAGAIGIEMACGLKSKGMDVTIVEALSSMFPRAIDSDMSLVLEGYLKEKGINVMLNSRIEKVEGNKLFIGESEIEADLIISATGVKPNVHIAAEACLKMNSQGIIVNEFMQTSKDNIYAAGDCIESVNLITGEKFVSALATTAYKQGKIAGENIAGKNSVYKGTISTFVSVFGDIEVACSGLNSYYAKENKFDVVIGKSISTDKPEWWGQQKKVIVKLIADKKTGKIIGGQSIGCNAFARMNVVSTAIHSGMTLQDLSDTELCYCPAVSQTYDVLHQAVDFALRRMG